MTPVTDAMWYCVRALRIIVARDSDIGIIGPIRSQGCEIQAIWPAESRSKHKEQRALGRPRNLNSCLATQIEDELALSRQGLRIENWSDLDLQNGAGTCVPPLMIWSCADDCTKRRHAVENCAPWTGSALATQITPGPRLRRRQRQQDHQSCARITASKKTALLANGIRYSWSKKTCFFLASQRFCPGNDCFTRF